VTTVHCIPTERHVGAFVETVCRDCGARFPEPAVEAIVVEEPAEEPAEEPTESLADVIQAHEDFRAALIEADSTEV
jgi:hypothetical protein